MRRALLALCACSAPAPAVTNAVPRPPSHCPPAAAFRDLAQLGGGDLEEWDLPLGEGRALLDPSVPEQTAVDAAHEITTSSLTTGPAWVIVEGLPACRMTKARLAKMAVCADGPCSRRRVSYDAMITASCPFENAEGAVDSGHAPVFVTDDPTGCKLERARDASQNPPEVPPQVKAAMAAIESVPGHRAELAVAPWMWEVGDWNDATMNQVNGECPMPIHVFVRAPDGIVELDVPNRVDGILADVYGPHVLITGEFGRDTRAFDFTNLPRHRAGVRSTSTKTCFR